MAPQSNAGQSAPKRGSDLSTTNELNTTTDAAEDDADSLASTVYGSEASDAEYEVEDILDHDVDANGVNKYLVKWANYPLDMCTWEPEENISNELLEDVWEEKLKRTDYQPFDRSLLEEAYKAKQMRHRRRNVRRKELGIEQTPPFLDDDDTLTSTEPSPGNLDEASTILESTEVPSDDDEIFVIESLSAPPKRKANSKKKRKGNEAASSAKRAEEAGKEKSRPTLSAATKRKSSKDGSSASPTPKNSASTSPRITTSSKPKTPGTRRLADRDESDDSESLPLALKKTSAPGRADASRAPKPSSQQPKTSKPRSASTDKPASASNQPQSATTARRNSKAFSARKTGTASQTYSGNVFSSGKNVRPTKSLATSMTNPKLQQQLFSNRRLLRLAELAEREKPDRLIEPSQLGARLFPITQGSPGHTLSSVDNVGSHGKHHTASARAADLPETKITKHPKKKKTVRFADATGRDGELILGKTRLRSPPVSRPSSDDNGESFMMQIETDQPEPMGQLEPSEKHVSIPNMNSELQIGPNGPLIEVIFSVSMQPDGPRAMVNDVFAKGVLAFNHWCLADTFIQQFGTIAREVFFSGNVMPTVNVSASSASIETVSEILKTRSSGLVLAQPTYALLIYPAYCDEWNASLFAPTLLPVAEDSSLRYVVFATVFDVTSLMRPLTDVDAEADDTSIGHEREYLMNMFFQMDRAAYFQLFPNPHRQSPRRHTIFFAFPPSASSSMKQLALWCRELDPDSAVFYSAIPGSWSVFLERIIDNRELGVVIVHELVTSALRRFPGLRKLLSTSSADCILWELSQDIRPQTSFAAISRRLGNVLSEETFPTSLGRACFTELFPEGMAILVTPSFLLVEPKRAYELFAWVAETTQNSARPMTLVTAWDICGYLRALADEKPQLRRDSDRDATRLSISEVCRYRLETWLLACELRDRLGQTFRNFPEDRGPIITYVDNIIDANDEQSLTNWFGWWSTLNMDRYRQFYVVGTGAEAKRTQSISMTHRIPVPNFSPETVFDPDVARQHNHYTIEAISELGEIDASSQPATKASTPPAATLRPDPGMQRRTEPPHYPDMPILEFDTRLMRYNRPDNFWRFYGKTVWWRDSSEAYANGYVNPERHTMRDWFTFTWPFSVSYRAYIGFFYMVDEEPGSSAGTGKDALSGHPWVVVYRPVDSHIKHNFERTELVFWDVRAKKRFYGHNVLRETVDLTAGQRALVDFIRKNGGTKNKGASLDRIYIGGEPQTLESKPRYDKYNGTSMDSLSDPTEVDVTMQFLDSLAFNFKDTMPPTGNYLKTRGFKEVLTRENERFYKGDQVGTKEAKEPERTRGIANENVKIVFHPPRGSQARSLGSSACRNRLFDGVEFKKNQSALGSTMDFEFVPTTIWYRRQVDEGRDYEHVHVEAWESVFKTLGIKTDPEC